MIARHRPFPSTSLSIFLLTGACLLCAPPAPAQSPSGSVTATDSSGSSGFADAVPPDAMKKHMLHNMATERNELRQKAIVDDADHLLALALQLKVAVEKSDKDQLSLSVVNTASEIEKLAKTVKDKMRDGD